MGRPHTSPSAWARRWPQAPPSQGLDLCLRVVAPGTGLGPQRPKLMFTGQGAQTMPEVSAAEKAAARWLEKLRSRGEVGWEPLL